MNDELIKQFAAVVKKAAQEGTIKDLAAAVREAALEIDDDDEDNDSKPISIASISISFGVKGDRKAASTFIKEVGKQLTQKFNKSFADETEIQVDGKTITVELIESTGSVMDPESFMELRKLRKDFVDKK